MSTTDWRHSIHGKIISIILTFALAFSFIPLSAYADEPEANDAPANAVPAESADSANEDATQPNEGKADAADTSASTDPVPADESEAPSASETAASESEEASAADVQLSQDVALDYVGYASVGNVIVKVTAPAGVVEVGTQVRATKVDNEAVIEAVEGAMASENKELADSIALDVELVNAEGAVVQPKGNVNVSFFDAAVEGDEFAVYHVSDDARQVQKVSTLQADSDVQSFNVNHFSIYVVGSSKAPTFVTYRFFVPSSADSSVYPDSANPSYTQTVQKGDALLAVPTPSYPGQTLAGWSTYPDPYNLSDCISSAELFSTVGDLEPNQYIIDYYAVYTQAVNVSFYGAASEGAPVIHVATGFNGEAIDTTAASKLVALADGEGVAGWSETPGGADKTNGGLYPISSNENVALYPIIKTGFAVTFDLNTTDTSAAYVEPRFVPEGKSYNDVFGSELPSTSRTGYSFAGWLTDDNADPAELLGAPLSGNATLKAQWTPGLASVKVVAYAETAESSFDAPDDQKDYERLVPMNPTDYNAWATFETGSKVDVASNASMLLGSYQYESQNYTVNMNKSTKTAYVEADGSTLVTIYLDRARKTVKLYTESTDGSDDQKIFAGEPSKTINYIYGQQIGDQIPESVDGKPYKWMSSTRSAEGTYVVNEWSQVVDKNALDALPFNGEEGKNEIVLCGLPIDEQTGTIFYYKWNANTATYAFDHKAPIYEGVTLSTFQGAGNLSLERFATVEADVDHSGTDQDITTLITDWDYSVDTSIPITNSGNVYVLYQDLNDLGFQDQSYPLSFIIPGANGGGTDLVFRSDYLEPGTPLSSYANVLNVPEMREGYLFKGWYLDPVYSESAEPYVLSDKKMPDHALTLFGFYVPQEPTLSVATDAVNVENAKDFPTADRSLNFGQRITAAQLPTVKAGDAIVSQGTDETITIPDGYAWYGWCTADGGTFAKFDFSTPIERNTTIVPYCTATTPYKVEYYVNDELATTDTVQYNALATAPVLPFIGEGTDFVCWNVEKNGVTYHYYPGAVTDQIGLIQTDGTVKMIASFKEELPKVQIVYHSADEATYQMGESIEANSETTILDYMFKDVPTGRAFIGWATDKNATAAEFVPGDTVVVTLDHLEVVETEDGLVQAANSLYPVFGYTITYDLDGGAYYETDADGFTQEIFPNPASYTTIAKDITLVQPTKRGYEFAGWTTDGVTEPVLDMVIKASTTGSLNFKANWKIKDNFYYTIRYVSNSDTMRPIIPSIESDDRGTKFGPYTYGDVVELPRYYVDVMKIPGYTFFPMSDTITIDDTDNVFILTCHPQVYGITYNLVGGGFPQESTGDGDTGDGGMGDGTTPPALDQTGNPESYSVESTPEQLTLQNPTRPGSDFLGWTVNRYTDYIYGEDGSTSRDYEPVGWAYDPNAVVINNGVDNLADLFIVANWKEHDPVTITYKAIGGGSVKSLAAGSEDSGAQISETVKPYSGEPTGALALASSNTRFVGWFAADLDAAPEDGAYDQGDDITSGYDYPKELTPEIVDRYGRVDNGAYGNVTFTAVFASSEYGDTYVVTYRTQTSNTSPMGTIAFESGDGTIYEANQYDRAIHSDGTDGVNARKAVVLPGFKGVDGWYVDGNKVAEGADLSADVIKQSIRSYQQGDTTFYTDTVFEARFIEDDPITYEFFGSEGGSVSESSVVVNPFSGMSDGSSVFVNALPQTGYVCDGWYTDPSFSAESKVSDFELLTVEPTLTDLPDYGIYARSVYQPAGPFYAKFRPDTENSYEVKFAIEGDSKQGGVALAVAGEEPVYRAFATQRYLHFMNGEDVVGATAQANAGYAFDGWYSKGELVATSASLDAATVQGKLVSDPETGTYGDILFTARFKEAEPVAYTYKVENEGHGQIRLVDMAGAEVVDSVRPVTGVPSKAVAVPAKGYAFEGWYDADGKKIGDKESFTPERVDGLYVGGTYTAKFKVDATQQYTITYTAQDGGQVALGTDDVFAANVNESLQVLNAADIKGARAQANDGMLFAGWYVGETRITDEVTTQLDQSMIVGHLNTIEGAYANTTFTAHFVKAPDKATQYTIKYVEYVNGKEEPVASSATFNGTVGQEVTAMISSFNGYKAASDQTLTLTLKEDATENIITVVYERRTDMSYVVNYFLEGTTDTVADQKTVSGQTFKSEATEQAIDVPGYNKVEPTSATITVGQDGNKFVEQNVISFYYTKRADLKYTVNYYLADSDNETVAESVTFEKQTYLDSVTVDAPEIPGYETLTGDAASQTITIGKNGEEFAENIDVNFYYTKRSNLTYTVNYIAEGAGENGTDKVLGSKIETKKTYKDEVTESAQNFEGYNKVDPTEQTFKVGVGENNAFIADQTINFYYTIRTDLSYTVKYVDADGKEIADTKTVTDQTFQAEVTEKPIAVEGYTCDAQPYTFTIGVSNDDVVFTYTKRGDLSYTVNYLEQGTNKPLATAKVVDKQTFGANVTESAIDIDGYDKVAPTEDSITIAETGNVFNFYYTKRTDISYKVVLKPADENDAAFESEELDLHGTYKEAVTIMPPPVEGYTVSPSSMDIVVGVDSEGKFADNQVFTFTYAKRNDLSYTVNYLEKDTNKKLVDPETVSGLTYLAEKTVEPVEVSGYNKPEAQTITIGKDGESFTEQNVVNFYYEKRTDLSYTVNYLEKDTNEVLVSAKTVDGQTFEESVTEDAIDIVGYDKPEVASQTITIKVEGNTIDFYYTKRTNLSYTVNYLEQGAGVDGADLVLSEPKVVTGQTFKAEVTESAIDVAGYVKPEASQTITIGVENNVINFYYTKRADLSYTVNYLERIGDEEKSVAPTKTVNEKTFKESVTENAIGVTGYNAAEPTSQTITIGVENNVINFYYTKKGDLTYTVNYLEQGTNAVLATAKTEGGQTFKSEVTENAIDIAGYNKVAPTTQTIIIEAENNVINFYYTKRTDLSYTVNYVEKGAGEDGADLVLATAKTVGGQTFQNKVTEQAIAIDGYNAPTEVEQTITIGVEGNVITFAYTKRTDLSYTVNYLEQGTNKPVSLAKTVENQTYKAEVTEQAIDVPGYNKVDPVEAKITIGVNNNVINFYYTKRADLSYTVNYLEQDTNAVLASAKTVNDQIFESEVIESAIDIAGYDKPEEASQSITIDVNGNVINFYYTKRTNLTYTVNYLEQGTGVVVKTAKTVENKTFKEAITENAEAVEGYNAVAPTSVSFQVGVGENDAFIENQTFTFQYTKRTDLNYTVKYVDADGNNVADPKIVTGQTFQAEVTEEPIAVEGYTCDAQPYTFTIEVSNDDVVFTYTKRGDLSYTVNYLEQGTNKPLATAKVVDKQTFGANVTESAIDIDGYNKVDPTEASITIAETGNVFNFYYTARTDLSYTVKYMCGDTEIVPAETVNNQTFGTTVKVTPKAIGGYVAPAAQNVTITTGENAVTFTYAKRNDLSYTVNYYLENTTDKVADSKTVNNQTFQAEVTEQAIDVAGYNRVDPTEAKITIGVENNTINFYYAKRTDLSYTVRYVAADNNGAFMNADRTTREVADVTVSDQTFQAVVDAAAQRISIDGYQFVSASPEKITIGANDADNVITFTYAKLTNLTYTVKYVDANGNAMSGHPSVTEYAAFAESKSATAPTIEGYNVDAPTKSIDITANSAANVISFVYTPRTDLSYIVKTSSDDGSLEPTEKTIGNQTFGDTVTVMPEAVDGYTVSPESATIIIGTTPETVKFTYTKRADLGYTVNYLERGAGENGADKVLREAKKATGQIFGNTVTYGNEIQGIDITGYVFNEAEPESFAISTNSSANVMNLYYVLRSDLDLTINYLNKSTNAPIKEAKSLENLTYGSTVSAADHKVDIEGYNFDSVSADEVTIGLGKNELTFYYTPRTDISYTVRYLLVGTTTPVKAEETVTNKTFGETVQVSAPQISGYTLVSSSPIKVELKASGNVFTFEYEPVSGLTYTVQYLNGSTVVESKVVTGGENGFTYGETVSVNAELPRGYALAEGESATQTYTVGASNDTNIVTFKVAPITGLSYTVKYLNADGAPIPGVSDKVVSGQTFGDKVTESAIDITGYDKPAVSSQEITIDIENNVITFYYTKVTGLSYTVKYVVDGTGEELGSKVVENKTFGDEVAEVAEMFAGYTATKNTIDVTVGVSTPDVIFTYTPNTDIVYTVRYVVKKSEGESAIADEKVVEGQTMASTVTETAKAVPGYTVSGQATQTLKLAAEDNVITFIYTPNTDIVYTVRYLDRATDAAVATEKVVEGQTMAMPATEHAIEVSGYKLDSAEVQTITLAAFDNVITFYYVVRTDLEYTVHYEDVNGAEIHEPMTIGGQTLGVQVKVTPLDINGYVTPAAQTITIEAENNTVTFVYEVQIITGNQSYTVHHVFTNGEAAADDATFDGFTAGDEVVVNALQIPGFAADQAQKTITIQDGVNEVVFRYRADFSDLVVRGFTGTYDATDHGVYVEGTLLDNDTVRFSVGGAGSNNTFRNAGTYTVDVTVTRIGQSVTRTGVVQIDKAPLTIATNSAVKQFDGQPLTAGGTMTGLVGGETVTFNITGSQTWWGSSNNTYELIWNGTANPSNYFIYKEGIGTLSVRLLPIEPGETPTDPVEVNRPINQPTFEGEDPVPPTDGIFSGADVNNAQAAGAGAAQNAPTQAQVTIPVEEITDDEAPLANATGEFLPGSEGLVIGDLDSKATAISMLTISGIVLTALYTTFAVMRRRRFMKDQSGLDDLL